MTLSSTKLIPELQSYISRFVVSSNMNKYNVPFSNDINDIFLESKSFIRMLFDNTYNHNEYYYCYNEDTSRGSWPKIVLDRMMVYPVSGQYFTCDSTGTNFFELESDDLVLLNSLLQYRLDSTSVTIIDSTSTQLIDSTSGYNLYLDYDNLNTELSKLISLYLKLKINEDYTLYDNLDTISTTNVLESIYELYVIDEFFTFISS